jgi:hypothetical protein
MAADWIGLLSIITIIILSSGGVIIFLEGLD